MKPILEEVKWDFIESESSVDQQIEFNKHRMSAKYQSLNNKYKVELS